MPKSGHSSKSFALVLSAITGSFISLCVAFVLIYDVLSDGVISTDLTDLGWFLLCTGIYSFGAGAGKVITDTVTKKIEARTQINEDDGKTSEDKISEE